MSDRSSNGGGEGLSLETLLIAATASAVAAVVVSQFWQGGTPIAAAITPVVVALVSEGLRRPMRSERVRSTTRRAVEPLRRTGGGSVPSQRRVGEEDLGYTVYGAGRGEAERGEGAGTRARDLLERIRTGLTPKRTRIALVTGLLAFVAAAAVITLPELLFGGSVTGDRSTTLFGGGGDDGGERDRDRDGATPGGGGDGRPESSPGSSPPEEDQPDGSQPPPSQPPPEEQPPSAPTPEAPTPQPVP